MLRSESDVAREFAREIARRLSRKTIRELKKMPCTMQGDLFNVWEEICVQVQYGPSDFWYSYVDLVEGLLEALVQELRPHEKAALWLQTEAAWDLYSEEGQEEIPVSIPEIVAYIANEYVFDEAGSWTNSRIEDAAW